MPMTATNATVASVHHGNVIPYCAATSFPLARSNKEHAIAPNSSTDDPRITQIGPNAKTTPPSAKTHKIRMIGFMTPNVEVTGAQE